MKDDGICIGIGNNFFSVNQNKNSFENIWKFAYVHRTKYSITMALT